MGDVIKRKRGRPVHGDGKNRKITVRVTDDFYNELKKLCAIEGESQTDYIIKSVTGRGNLTKFKAGSSDFDE